MIERLAKVASAGVHGHQELISLPKSSLTNYVGSLKTGAMRELAAALAVSLGLDDADAFGPVN